MRLLSLQTPLTYPSLTIETVTEDQLLKALQHKQYDYLIIHGGDGTIRRTLQSLQPLASIPPIILNPTGSFNVIAKRHHVAPLNTILQGLAEGKQPQFCIQKSYTLNNMLFLFSAGNMGDLQHIFLAETLRFGWLKKGMGKYIVALLFLLPLHLFITPFMLMSKERFFIFTPLEGVIDHIGNLYGKVPSPLTIELQNTYNFLELDGDIVLLKDNRLHIKESRKIKIITKM